MRFVLATAGLLLLAACSGESQSSREDEITDIASDAAVGATAEKFSELEGRIDDLETAKESLETEIAEAEAQAAQAESDLETLRSEYEGHTH